MGSKSARPQGNVPGERSPTLPFSVDMPSIGNKTLTESDMWGATPFCTMSAIDLKTHKLVWRFRSVPCKTPARWASAHLPIPIGMPILGASLAESGLLFFAGTQDVYLRAFDTGSGNEIWKARLPVGSQPGPMTYVSPKTGKQYILLTVGGARQSTDRGDYVIAYALPK
ncbi:hypothetical protein [Pseudomonas sp.]